MIEKIAAKAVEVSAKYAEKVEKVGVAAKFDPKKPLEVGKTQKAEKTTFDAKKPLDINEKPANDKEKIDGEKLGGSYKEVKKNANGETHEVHHMPPDCATELRRDDGPAIKMEKAEHRQTASCGLSPEAREYQKKQRELCEQGKFREALQNDIDDIREKFKDKYDKAIEQMLEYVDKLEKEGKI